MSDFNLVDPKGWEYDLQSVYAAYVGYFQQHSIPWYERTWGHLFSSFSEFLNFEWPVITITDARTGHAHIVTRLGSIGAFLKMIKTRFGETLPSVSNIIVITPFETTQRPLRTVSDYATYKRLHATLPATALSARRARIKSGEPKSVQALWEERDKTFVAIDFEWSERNEKTILEWGYAAVRCGHIDAEGQWPPIPDHNYRKGHYIVAEHVDRIINKHAPTYPWLYAFGESQVIPKAKLPEVIEAVLSSLSSPHSETTANMLVLVGHGLSGDLARLSELGIKLPQNMLQVDTASLERALFAAGRRPPSLDRARGTTLTLDGLLRTLPGFPAVTLHNAGNDAFMCLAALQAMLDPANTTPPTPRVRGAGRQRLTPTLGAPVRSSSAQGFKSSGTPSPVIYPTDPTEFGLRPPLLSAGSSGFRRSTAYDDGLRAGVQSMSFRR